MSESETLIWKGSSSRESLECGAGTLVRQVGYGDFCLWESLQLNLANGGLRSV